MARRPRLAAPAAALGLAFGAAWLGAGTWWLFVSMHRYGGLPAWLAALAVWPCRCFSRSISPARWPPPRAGARRAVARRSCSPRPGCSRSWHAASSSPAFPGSRAATRRSIRRSAASHHGSASTGSARSPPGSSAGVRIQPVDAPARLAGAERGLARRARAGRVRRQRRLHPQAGTLRVTLLQGNVPQDEKFSMRYVPRRSSSPPLSSGRRAAIS